MDRVLPEVRAYKESSMDLRGDFGLANNVSELSSAEEITSAITKLQDIRDKLSTGRTKQSFVELEEIHQFIRYMNERIAELSSIHVGLVSRGVSADTSKKEAEVARLVAEFDTISGDELKQALNELEFDTIKLRMVKHMIEECRSFIALHWYEIDEVLDDAARTQGLVEVAIMELQKIDTVTFDLRMERLILDD